MKPEDDPHPEEVRKTVSKDDKTIRHVFPSYQLHFPNRALIRKVRLWNR